MEHERVVSYLVRFLLSGCVVCCGAIRADAKLGDEILKIDAPDATNQDNFGLDVAISGNVAVVGAVGDYYYIQRVNRHPGAAYLYDVTSGQQLFKLMPADSKGWDEFGQAVAIDGGLAVIGASQAAYVFNVMTGQQLWKLTPSDSVNRFGYAVAINGNVAAVGAGGSAYVFDLTTGEELRKLNISDVSVDDAFHTVAISSDFVLLGAVEDDHAGRSSGAAFLFDAATGAPLRKLTASDAVPYQLFGASVSIYGNRALIGAYGEGGAGVPGTVYLFDLDTGQELLKLRSNKPPHVSDGGVEYYDRFGTSAVLVDNLALIGAPSDHERGLFSGAAHLFDVTTGELVHTFHAFDAEPFDYFGYTVAMNNAVAFAGRTPERGGLGSAYIFSLTPEPTSFGLMAVAGFGVIIRARHRRRA